MFVLNFLSHCIDCIFLFMNKLINKKTQNAQNKLFVVCYINKGSVAVLYLVTILPPNYLQSQQPAGTTGSRERGEKTENKKTNISCVCVFGIIFPASQTSRGNRASNTKYIGYTIAQCSTHCK